MQRTTNNDGGCWSCDKEWSRSGSESSVWFGVMDTEAMVTRARHLVNIPPQMKDQVTNISRLVLYHIHTTIRALVH